MECIYLYITMGTNGVHHGLGIVLKNVMNTIFHCSDASYSIAENECCHYGNSLS